MEMHAEWSLAARTARVREIEQGKVMHSREHLASVGANFFNSRETNKAIYLENGYSPMNAAAPLILDGLGLDAAQVRALQDHIAASRNTAEVRVAPPPLFGPGAVPMLPPAARPEAIQEAADAPAPNPSPPEAQQPPRRGRGRPRGSQSEGIRGGRGRGRSAAQRPRQERGLDGSDSDPADGVDDADGDAPHNAVEEEVDDLYMFDFDARNGDVFVWERVDVRPVPQVDLRGGSRPVPTLPGFTKGPTAPRNIPQGCNSAFDILKLLIDAELIDRMCTFTNRYARESSYANSRRFDRWYDVEAAEMWSWIACVIYLGVCKVNSREAAWSRSSPFGQPSLYSRMSLERFEAIARCLHVDAPFALDDAERTRRMNADPFWQIESFARALSDNFTNFINAGQCLDLDECTCGYRGTHRCRCFNPNKPKKYHFKEFCINCAVTGYIIAFYWYRGKSEQRPTGMPATLWPLVHLVERINSLTNNRLKVGNHIMATDNWYTSLQAARFCHATGLHYVGTLRSNRINCASPPAGAIFPKSAATSARGSYACHKVSCGSFSMFVTPWADNKVVHMLHSWPTYVATCYRNHKQAIQGAPYEKKAVDRPTIYQNYNECMGGTDLHDWLLAEYRSSFRCKRWQPKVIVHMLQQAVVNAHILFRLKHGSPSSRTLFVFVTELMEAIPVYKRRGEVRADANVAFQVAVNQSRWWWSHQHARRTTGTHTPDTVSRPRGENGQRTETRKRCKYCMHRLSHIYCTSCDVFLCGGDCWRLFHSEDTLPNQDELLARANSSPSSD